MDTTAENSELLQDRRKRLERLLKPPRGEAAQNIARDIVLSEALVGKGEAMFRERLPHGLGSPLQAGFGKRTECDVALDDYLTRLFFWKALADFVFTAHHQALAPHRAMLVTEKRRPCRSLRWS